MRLLTLSKLVLAFYNRNIAKNIMMVAFMLFTNLIFGLFSIFIESEKVVIPTLSASYLEHLSVDVSLYESISTNNDLINVKRYKRPSISYLESFSSQSEFIIRPDFSKVFRYTKVSIHDKELPLPEFVVINNIPHDIGINESFLEVIKESVSVDEKSLLLDFNLLLPQMKEDSLNIEYNTTLKIDFIYQEPAYFSVPKIYISQDFVDQNIGSLKIYEELMLSNYLFNLHSEHEMTNYRFRLHFNNYEERMKFIKIVEDINTNQNGVELTSDEIIKVKSFSSLYDYLNILVTVFLGFIIIGGLVMNGIISYTALMSLQKQMALLNILGATKVDLLFLFILINLCNFIMGLMSFLLLPYLLPVVSTVFYKFLHIRVAISMNLLTISTIIFLNIIVFMILLILLFLINNRRPLLYLLLDA
ncbi:MAG: hypothetical protein RBS24_05050 [Bacilli bacterium]|nr:hypothetical protein [Bacilli bacterium]